MNLKTFTAAALLAASSAWAQTPATAPPVPVTPPSPAELLKPAPNSSWSAFSVRGSDVIELAPGLYTFRYQGTRNIFMVTKDGVIASDPINTEAAKLLRAEIRKVTDKPVKYVVYSHNHWDHAPGGQIFKDEGAKFISHKNCVAHFKDKPNPDIVMPDITFEKTYAVKLGGRKLDLIYLGVNHGDCLIFMQPDTEGGKYLFGVDIATPGGAPLTYIPVYDLHNWLRTLKELEAMNFSVLIPGHGVPIADKSSLNERRRYMEALMAAVKKAIDEGMPGNEIPDKVRVPEFAYLRGYETNIRDNVRRIQTYYGIGE
ncbi:MAG: MBL fold metallo-hydrolase [Rhodospirillaceae bacterium]|nr:MBL fold metallo-hydrolase [Rhodospirillaceae bacterium]